MSGTWKGTTYIADRDAYDDLTIVLKKEGPSYTGAVTDSLGMARGRDQNVAEAEAGFDFTIYNGEEYRPSIDGKVADSSSSASGRSSAPNRWASSASSACPKK
jgi:hypothetical protein